MIKLTPRHSGPPFTGLAALAPEVVRAELGVERVTGKPLWYLTRDGDVTCLALYRKHYSCRNKQPKQSQFVGPGEHIVLRTDEGDAVFVWRAAEYRADGQEGVECSLFRNEGPRQSSELIRQADAIADHCWPGRRHYTFVDAKEVRSSNPGYCFLAAGWRRCGRSAGGLLILERPNPEPVEQPVDHGAEWLEHWIAPTSFFALLREEREG